MTIKLSFDEGKQYVILPESIKTKRERIIDYLTDFGDNDKHILVFELESMYEYFLYKGCWVLKDKEGNSMEYGNFNKSVFTEQDIHNILDYLEVSSESVNGIAIYDKYYNIYSTLKLN